MPHFYTVLSGVLYCLAIAVWLVCGFYMGVIVLSWYEYALDPAGNKLVGIVWFLVGPAIPLGAFFAAGLLYVGTDTLYEVAPRLLKMAWLSIPIMFVGFTAGFFVPGTLVTVGAMGAAVLFHVVAVLLPMGAAAYHGRAPWTSPDPPDSD